MTIFQAIILGIIQGITEFLPISSSGHLVIAPYFFGWNIPSDQEFVFDVLVQVGTLAAVFAYFWKDIWSITAEFLNGIIHKQPFRSENARLGWYIILATIPAATAGIAIKDLVEATFDSVFFTAVFLLVTALLLFGAEKLEDNKRKTTTFTWKDALVIGFFQILALFPGVSRSGSTIAGGMVRHIERPIAARFSFLMSIPIMLGAGLASVFDLAQIPNINSFLPPLIIGFISSAIVGYIAIRWLLAYLVKNPLYVFAVYVTVVSGITLVSML